MREITFGELQRRESHSSPIEVTLFEGVRFDQTVSPVPWTHRENESNKPGVRVVGYVSQVTEKYFGLIQENRTPNILGGCNIYENAIHSMRELS